MWITVSSIIISFITTFRLGICTAHITYFPIGTMVIGNETKFSLDMVYIFRLAH